MKPIDDNSFYHPRAKKQADYETPKGPPCRETEVNCSKSVDRYGKPMLVEPKGKAPTEEPNTPVDDSNQRAQGI